MRPAPHWHCLNVQAPSHRTSLGAPEFDALMTLLCQGDARALVAVGGYYIFVTLEQEQ